MRDIKIKYNRELSYLGVIFDEGLTWSPHVRKLKDKITLNTMKLCSISRVTWGVSGELLKSIYLNVLEKQITYGAEVWYNGTVRIITKLNSIQRIPLLSITKCYKTASTEALQILAGVLPVHLRCEALVDTYNIQYRNCSLILGSEEFNVSNVEWKRKYIDAPWEKKDFIVRDQDRIEDNYLIYTDGSKMNNKVGCAYVQIINNVIGKEVKIRISDNASVYQAELIAIYEGIKDYEKNEYQYARICSDSLSALNAINNYECIGIARDIREVLHSTSKKYTFSWVKAHVGEVYNELADQLAKQATAKENIEYQVKTSFSSFKKLLYKDKEKIWQDNWIESTKGRPVYSLIPKISTKRRYDKFFINMIITQHGAFPSYQNRFHGKSDTCWCNVEVGDVNHIIYNCILFNDIRSNYFPSKYRTVDIKNLINSAKSRKGLEKIMERCLTYCLDDSDLAN